MKYAEAFMSKRLVLGEQLTRPITAAATLPFGRSIRRCPNFQIPNPCIFGSFAASTLSWFCFSVGAGSLVFHLRLSHLSLLLPFTDLFISSTAHASKAVIRVPSSIRTSCLLHSTTFLLTFMLLLLQSAQESSSR